MSVLNMFILTAAQRTAAMAFNNDDVAIDPRAVDNASPGVGLNLNPAATGIAAGAAVALVGKFVAPKRIVDDQQYVIYAPDLIAYLLDKPWATLDSDTIFAPAAGPGG